MACSSLLSDEDLSRFRTKPCRRVKAPEGCDFGSRRCQYSHNDYWPRRCPFYLSDPDCLRYVPMACPDVSLGMSDEILSNRCKRGGSCPFAHSNEEIVYHPLFYKMHICQKYQEGGCDTYYCPFIHGFAEKRALRAYKLPYTKGIDIPPIEGVSLVERTGDPLPEEQMGGGRRVLRHDPAGGGPQKPWRPFGNPANQAVPIHMPMAGGQSSGNGQPGLYGYHPPAPGYGQPPPPSASHQPMGPQPGVPYGYQQPTILYPTQGQQNMINEYATGLMTGGAEGGYVDGGMGVGVGGMGVGGMGAAVGQPADATAAAAMDGLVGVGQQVQGQVGVPVTMSETPAEIIDDFQPMEGFRHTERMLFLNRGDQVLVTIHKANDWTYGKCTQGRNKGCSGWFPSAAVRFTVPQPQPPPPHGQRADQLPNAANGTIGGMAMAMTASVRSSCGSTMGQESPTDVSPNSLASTQHMQQMQQQQQPYPSSHNGQIASSAAYFAPHTTGTPYTQDHHQQQAYPNAYQQQQQQQYPYTPAQQQHTQMMPAKDALESLVSNLANPEDIRLLMEKLQLKLAQSTLAGNHHHQQQQGDGGASGSAGEGLTQQQQQPGGSEGYVPSEATNAPAAHTSVWAPSGGDPTTGELGGQPSPDHTNVQQQVAPNTPNTQKADIAEAEKAVVCEETTDASRTTSKVTDKAPTPQPPSTSPSHPSSQPPITTTNGSSTDTNASTAAPQPQATIATAANAAHAEKTTPAAAAAAAAAASGGAGGGLDPAAERGLHSIKAIISHGPAVAAKEYGGPQIFNA
ncbi:unnamed protein product [Vitrella brassicaformis CCMP3155]|uniref:C3H1-type domain-containing protein n=3 Tax=Vitrella brassicaformis TaxID=1169539 RepID=A0A0G4F8H6_VITBC|nr:unnamed protein product [Vitrella brassicaformis CCMP3155]|eukprot:CEM09035.1 unnamed protein product [Vitrella brassicaformis CCMP3155]